MSDPPRKVDVDAEVYDARWERLAAAGASVHGEADLVEHLLRDAGGGSPGHASPARVLDAGCGTGRVAIRLAAQGCVVCGVDIDDSLLDHARAKAPGIEWYHRDLAQLGADDAPGPFDAIVLAGNVMIFLAPGTAPAVVRNLASRLAPGGLLVAGFQLRRGGLTADDHDASARAAGVTPIARWSTWDGAPFTTDSDYVVAVSKR